MRTLAQSGRAAHRAAALRRGRDRDQPGHARPRSAASRRGGCLMVTGYEGTQEAVDGPRVRRAPRCSPRLGGASLGEDEGWADGPVPRPLPARLAARRRRARGDAGDGDLLVAPAQVYDAVKAALTASLGEGTLVLCHISHVYETGASLYFTVATRQADDPVAQWLAAKAAASDAMIDHGASITHHHAVGQDHKPWLAREIGPVGVRHAAGPQGRARPHRRAQPRRADPLTRMPGRVTRWSDARAASGSTQGQRRVHAVRDPERPDHQLGSASAVSRRPPSSGRRAASPGRAAARRA